MSIGEKINIRNIKKKGGDYYFLYDFCMESAVMKGRRLTSLPKRGMILKGTVLGSDWLEPGTICMEERYHD